MASSLLSTLQTQKSLIEVQTSGITLKNKIIHNTAKDLKTAGLSNSPNTSTLAQSITSSRADLSTDMYPLSSTRRSRKTTIAQLWALFS